MTTALHDTPLRVDALDLEGQGIARREDGKVVFIEGALPGEQVHVRVLRRKNQWEQGVVQDVLRTSPLRVTPDRKSTCLNSVTLESRMPSSA